MELNGLPVRAAIAISLHLPATFDTFAEARGDITAMSEREVCIHGMPLHRECDACNQTGRTYIPATSATAPANQLRGDVAPLVAGELLPCPFCGGHATMHESDDHGDFIQCDNLQCEASSCLQYSTKEDGRPQLIARWNRRAATANPELRAPSSELVARPAKRVVSKEVTKHREEFPREASNKYFARKATVDDLIELIFWELVDCLYSLPPDCEKNGLDEDGFHAGCAALRAYSMLMQVKDKLGDATAKSAARCPNCGEEKK